MIEHLATIERDALGTSRVHLLDARVKILISFAAIITMVAMPYPLYGLVEPLRSFTAGIFLAIHDDAPLRDVHHHLPDLL